MIKNLNQILSQNIGEMEWILQEFVKETVELEQQGKLTINSIEKLAGKTIMNSIRLVLTMSGVLLGKAYKDKGYYIGSGGIESANKMVIQQRMKQSGMRWSIPGGQYIAALRTKHESGLWDDVVRIVSA